MELDADRRGGSPMVCPFVAFADERDLRAATPDHRHRCYAEARPAPRALAHQERYCLSPGFTACPTFQDWAVREAALVSGEPPAEAAASAAEPGFFDEPVRPQAPLSGVVPRAGAGRDAYAKETPGGADEESAEPSAYARPSRVPEWDRPRRREAYPKLRGSRASLAPLIIGIVLLGLAAIALFTLPGFISGMFGGGAKVSLSPLATPSASATATTIPGAPTPTLGPGVTPGATGLTYTVKSGDTMTKIAKMFNVTLDQLLAANPQLKDPNKIDVGDVIFIPTSGASPGASPTGSAAP